MTAGPRQELFTNELMSGLQKRYLVPFLQQIAGRTLTETRPRIEEEFVKIGQRTPELTEAATKELTTLQTNLEARGGKVVEATLVPMLERRESQNQGNVPRSHRREHQNDGHDARRRDDDAGGVRPRYSILQARRGD